MSPSPEKPFWRSIGVWMAAAAALLMFVNAARAFGDPSAFSAYLGLPITDPAQSGFVLVYALRAAFIGLAVVLLLYARERRALGLFALAAVVMPVGDAWLTAAADAPAATIGRHVAIAAFLLVAAVLLLRQTATRAAV